MSRRLISLAVAGLTLALAGCGSSDDNASSAAAAGTTPAEGSFPAKVVHEYGTTTVPRQPERIVVAGYTEQDTVLALGEQPLATTEWYGEHPYATWPWAQQALGDAKPTVLKTDDGFEYEKIASLRPDLIIAVNAGLEKKDYAKLSKIAPTVGPPAGASKYFSPWDQQVRTVAASLGKADEGDQLIDDVKASYAKAAAEYPQFAGKTLSFAQNAFYSGLLYAYPDGLSTDSFTMLGFKINPKLTPLIEKEGEQVAISEERLDVLDADVIVFATESEQDIPALKKVPTFNELGAVKENRAVFTDPTLAGALYFDTPLAHQYVVRHLPQLLDQAVAGKSPQTLQGG